VKYVAPSTQPGVAVCVKLDDPMVKVPTPEQTTAIDHVWLDVNAGNAAEPMPYATGATWTSPDDSNRSAVGPSMMTISQLIDGSALTCRLIGPLPPLPGGPDPNPPTPDPVGFEHWNCLSSPKVNMLPTISSVSAELPELHASRTSSHSSGPTLNVGSVIEPVP
jgi:hypothetical protein